MLRTSRSNNGLLWVDHSASISELTKKTTNLNLLPYYINHVGVDTATSLSRLPFSHRGLHLIRTRHSHEPNKILGPFLASIASL